MHYPKIQSAEAIDDHTLLVTFTNNEQRTYDITSLLEKDMFIPLKNPGFFRNFIMRLYHHMNGSVKKFKARYRGFLDYDIVLNEMAIALPTTRMPYSIIPRSRFIS